MKLQYLVVALCMGLFLQSCTPEQALDAADKQACCDEKDPVIIPPPPPPPPTDDN